MDWKDLANQAAEIFIYLEQNEVQEPLKSMLLTTIKALRAGSDALYHSEKILSREIT